MKTTIKPAILITILAIHIKVALTLSLSKIDVNPLSSPSALFSNSSQPPNLTENLDSAVAVSFQSDDSESQHSLAKNEDPIKDKLTPHPNSVDSKKEQLLSSEEIDETPVTIDEESMSVEASSSPAITLSPSSEQSEIIQGSDDKLNNTVSKQEEEVKLQDQPTNTPQKQLLHHEKANLTPFFPIPIGGVLTPTGIPRPFITHSPPPDTRDPSAFIPPVFTPEFPPQSPPYLTRNTFYAQPLSILDQFHRDSMFAI